MMLEPSPKIVSTVFWLRFMIFSACPGIELKRGRVGERILLWYKWQVGPCFASKLFESASSRDGETTCVTYSTFQIFS